MQVMKILSLVVVVLLLAICAVGWLMTYQALGDTESQLDDARADIADVEQQLQDTQDSLAETRDELLDTSANLSSTQSELAEQINETNEYIDLYEETRDLYEETRDELDKTEKELDSLADDLKLVEQKNENLEEELAEIQEQLDLYQDTLGISVYSGVDPPYRSGNVLHITLTNNISAKDPTWAELKAFLREDTTDKLIYKPGEFECGNFAMLLHDNAEAAGIRTAFVAILFHDEIPHAVNAFKTVDEGLVYIDVTGSTHQSPIPYLDTKVILTKDGTMERSFVFPSYGYYWPPGEEVVVAIEIYW